MGKENDMKNKESQYVKILREICEEEGIRLFSYSSDWAFMLEKEGKRAFILGYQFGLNASSVQQICTDKNIASEILRQEGIPSVYHSCYMSTRLQSCIGADGNWSSLLGELQKYGTIVCKDNYGTGGNQVYLVKTPGELEDAAGKIFAVSDAMAVCPYEEIREEYRMVILDGEIRLAFTKLRPALTGDGEKTVRELFADAVLRGEADGMTVPDAKRMNLRPQKGEQVLLGWKHNLGQGARALELDLGQMDKNAAVLADRVYRALNIRFASVDVIHCADGWKVLEVNSGVMMEHFASTGPDYYRKAKSIYRDAVLRML